MTKALLILPADLRHGNAAACLAQLQFQIQSSTEKEVEIQAGAKRMYALMNQLEKNAARG